MNALVVLRALVWGLVFEVFIRMPAYSELSGADLFREQWSLVLLTAALFLVVEYLYTFWPYRGND